MAIFIEITYSSLNILFTAAPTYWSQPIWLKCFACHVIDYDDGFQLNTNAIYCSFSYCLVTYPWKYLRFWSAYVAYLTVNVITLMENITVWGFTDAMLGRDTLLQQPSTGRPAV